MASLKKGGLYVVFDILFQIWSKRRYLQHMPPAQTYWLADYRTKLIYEWLNELMSLQCPFDLSQRYFIKIPRLQCPNQGSHMMEFLLLSLKSVCMIVIRALTGMQLINHEEKMLRWQTQGFFCSSSKNSSKLLFLQFWLFERSCTRIRWRDFTGANPSKLTSLLTFVCVLCKLYL